jgi:hypothetical protein
MPTIAPLVDEAETMRRKILLIHEGWAFVSDVIGGTRHYRAVSPDGWVSLVSIAGLTEAWAIDKAWGKRFETAQAQFRIAEWIRKHGENAGITWDKTQGKYCASLFVKNKAPKEAYGDSPVEAVSNWLEDFSDS